MTHKECVDLAERYLTRKNPVVLSEFFCWNEELADVIGFKPGFSTLVECKVSRADFLADRKKSFRIRPSKGMGNYRFYCCPKGLILPEEVPEGWGLLYAYPSGLVKTIKKPVKMDKSIEAEHHLLYYYARRARYAGVHSAIVDYRGFDA